MAASKEQLMDGMEQTEGAPARKPRVRLVGEDGNAYSILGRVRRALREAGASTEYIERYTAQATASDYDHLLAVTMEHIEEGSDEDELEEERCR